jgi:hypothetical protein
MSILMDTSMIDDAIESLFQTVEGQRGRVRTRRPPAA